VKLPDRSATQKHEALKKRARKVAETKLEDRAINRHANSVNLEMVRNHMDEFDRLQGVMESHARLGVPTTGLKERQLELKRLASIAMAGGVEKHPLFK